MGADLSQVRVHTGPDANQLAEQVSAEAFTYRQDVVFSSGAYQPSSPTGRRLLAHELAHTMQQRGGSRAGSPMIARQSRSDVDYEKARRWNLRLARRVSWGATLGTYRPEWVELWDADSYDAFADQVARFQADEGMKADGILGQRTWDRIRPIGDVIADYRVRWAKSREVCTIAAKERLTGGYRRATGERLVSAGSQRTANRILQSYSLSQVDERYRGTGPAGFLVYTGHGEFVDEDGIWRGRELRPGAAIQVWGSRKSYERLVGGEDIHPYGTAAVFVRYTDDGMVVLHFDSTETWSRTRYQVWIAANLEARD